MKFLNNVTGFEWDDGNQNKNFIKHGVSKYESEEVFFSDNKVILEDMLHSDKEERWLLLGETYGSKRLFIVFTIRKDKIRVISARILNKREYKLLK